MHVTLHDLKPLIEARGPFFSVAIPAPSHFDNSSHRFEVEWKNVRKGLSADWSGEELAAVDATVSELRHYGGESVVVLHAMYGETLIEFLDEPVQHADVHEGPLPRLATLIEARQRVIPHVIVETDRAGADLTAFDGGRVLDVDQVEGDTLYIHRGHAGGWSQRRFQQRAENTWERNANDVADAVAAMARDVDARLIAVAGDVRARTLVLESLPKEFADRAVKIEAGSPEHIADEVVRMLADQVATQITDLADQLRTRLSAGTACVGVTDTLSALREGRVDTLLVHDDRSPDPTTTSARGHIPAGTRVVDVAIVEALRTDAAVVIVPSLAALEGPVAALMRW
jgi:Bacterial archaeo-eukaryotic release factor family 2